MSTAAPASATLATNRALKYLVKDDWKLMEQVSRQAVYLRDDLIVQEGSRRQELHILREGTVRLEKSYFGQGVTIAHLGAGELFGESSLLHGEGADVTVIADSDREEVDVVELSELVSLLGSVVGFATRFYHSMALGLADRLKLTSAQLPSLLVEDISFGRSEAVGPVLVKGTRLSPRLVAEVEEFKTAMLMVDRGLIDNKLVEGEAQRAVDAACDRIEGALRRHVESESHLEKEIGAFVFRETFPLFTLSNMADRTFSKPRGYAGDFFTIEMIYEDRADGQGRLGPYIDRWVLDRPSARAVKNRRGFLAQMIHSVASGCSDEEPLAITSLACGPAREIFDILEAGQVSNIRATCVDIDHEALAYAAGLAEQRGVTQNVTFVQDNVVRMSLGRGKVTIPPQKLIYSIGLIDYLQDDLVVKLIDWSHDHLVQGGTLVLGNFDISNPNKAYMDHVLEWVLIHRSAEQLIELFSRSKFGGSRVSVEAEASGINLFASCSRA